MEKDANPLKANPKVYNLQFTLLCLSSFLFFVSFNMIIPELPNYLTSLGGEDYKGLIIALFTLTAGLSRPFSGKLADKVGRIPVMIFGAVVCFFCGFFYPILTSVAGFLFIRFVHGFSTGFTPTGTSAYVADLIPANRRGEAMGILGFASSIGMASGPTIGGELILHFPIETLFYTSSAAAILSILILIGMKETLQEKEPFHWKLLYIKPNEVIEPRVLHPSIVMVLCVFSFGAILTIIPDFSEYLGLQNKGLYFSSFTLASLASRLLSGKASDKHGRVPVLLVSVSIIFIALTGIGFTHTVPELLFWAAVMGFGVGMNSPTLVAWTIDLAEDQHRGKALSTMYIALEIGVGSGALAAGWIYGNNPAMFPFTFWLCAFLAFLAFIFLYFHHSIRKTYRKPVV